MKNLAYDLAYLGGFWYTLVTTRWIVTIDSESKTVFSDTEVTGDWCCPWSSKPVLGR